MRVGRDFVLKKTGPYIDIVSKATQDVYGRDYKITCRNNVIEYTYINILIDNKTFRVYSMEIKENTRSFSKTFLDIEVGIFEDFEVNEEIYFKINSDTKIKILVLPEQRHIFSKEKLNITYPISGNIQNYSDWRQNEFKLISLIEKKIEGRLFYEANLVFNNTEREITDLRYSFKETFNKHFLIPREKVLKCYEYEE